MCKEAIAQQNAQRISPARVHGRLGAAPLGFVHDVVVHQRRDVNQFNNYGKIDMSGVDLAGRAAGQERNQRSQTFPMSPESVTDVTLDRRIKSGRLFDDSFYDLIEFWLDQLRDSRQRRERRTTRLNPSPAWTRACRNFHRRRIEGRVVGCQSNTLSDDRIL